MVLILSDEYDSSTNNVIDYLNYFNADYLRINENNILEVKFIKFIDGVLSFSFEVEIGINKHIVNSSQIKAFWYRRGWFTIKKKSLGDYFFNSWNIGKVLNNYIQNETMDVVQFFYSYLNSIKHIGYFNDNYTNKLFNLNLASKFGLKIPETIVTTNKSDIEEMLKKFNKIIVKSIKDGGISLNNEFDIGSFTRLILPSDMDEIPNIFYPSLVQEYAEKEQEIRTFYLNEVCYSACIFSQLDERTKIDFRNYNIERPNRIIPFELPLIIQERIKLFMQKLNLTSGSIDLIYTKNKDYVFLEVNPVGQYDFISKRCNFYLDKNIAISLI